MKFSIVTCTYNSEKYLQRNIASVIGQTCKDFEHIFIDGLSTDKTIEIIKNYQKKFPEKIKLFHSPPRGIGNAMNIGIEKSSGEYIIHLHSDDSFYDLNILEKINNFIIKNGNPEWIYGKALFINEIKKNNRVIPHRKIYKKIRFWLLLLTNYIPHQSVFIKKEVFEKYGFFDEYYNNSMDYDMWLRLSKSNITSKFFNEIICKFFIHEKSQSTIGKLNNEHNFAHKKHLKNKTMLYFLNFIDKLNKKRIL